MGESKFTWRWEMRIEFLVPLLSAAFALTQAAPAGEVGVIYDLLPGSVLINDCPMCGRRPIQFDLTGSFVLTANTPGVDSRSYDISAVDFHATTGDTDIPVTGSGKYSIVFPSLESLVLDLDMEAETIHFESDGTKNAATWPLLDMTTVEKPGSASRVITIRINASPRAFETVTYNLGEGSTFFDAPFNIEVSISGTFTLSKVEEGPLNTTYRVDAVEFHDSSGTRGLHITGSGNYVLGGEFALNSSMHLDLTVANGKVGRPVAIESPSAPVAVPPPDMDLALEELNPPPPDAASRLHLIATAEATTTGPKFRRGDANDDGTEDLSDGVFVLSWLFLGETAPTCQDAADANDDGSIDLSDAVSILGWLFLSGDQPPAPGPKDCGPDITPSPQITTPCDSQACK
jgi:hypothetical protein